jgi:hypothetical protein
MIFMPRSVVRKPQTNIRSHQQRQRIRRSLASQQQQQQQQQQQSTEERRLFNNVITNYETNNFQVRTISINERLASIGGLFGAFSILLTGALLYAIFTAKQEDKWYYAIAVMINISLLVLLMVSAIVFDRYYLKSSNRRTLETINNGRTINTQPILYPFSSTSMNNSDMPPMYPGYSSNSTSPLTSISIPTNKPIMIMNTNDQEQQQIIERVTIIDIQTPSTPTPSSSPSSNINKTKKEDSKQPPPDYFDLYPSINR